MSRPPTTMSRQPTIIYSADNIQQAHLLRSLLADEGIQAWVVNDAIQGAGGELPVGWTAAAKVVVAGDQAEEARQFAEKFDQKTNGRRRFVDEDDADDKPPAAWPSWPSCPTCGERRSARCPVCGVSGTDFPLADIPDAGEGGQPLLLCQSCDDLILPKWYRLCVRCGHDFGEGLEVDEQPAGKIEISPRTIAVLAVLLLLGMSVVGYFVWLLRG